MADFDRSGYEWKANEKEEIVQIWDLNNAETQQERDVSVDKRCFVPFCFPGPFLCAAG